MITALNLHIPADDPERLQRFYADVFGWTTRNAGTAEQPYLVGRAGAIDFAIVPRSNVIPRIVPTIDVRLIDQALHDVSMNGGRPGPVNDLPGSGRFGYAIDCDGNLIALLERLR